MIILFSIDKDINESDELTGPHTTTIESGLHRFSDLITRIEVQLSDELALKQGVISKRCMLEARLENGQPISVTEYANTTTQAISGALEKLRLSLEAIVGKLSNHSL
jgi:hypothetical protein